ncbi:MAG TPA: hypothetical protein VK087_08510 [Tissierellaceae bacterium]|nr:hypothetical protein [Tissierellaceae bacterium]
MKNKFITKDIVFLAILSAVLLLISSLIMPLVMFTNIYALRQLFSATIFALFSIIGLKKVPKLGALTIMGIFTGGVLLFLSPIMFFNQVLAALITEILIYIIFKSYESDRSKKFAATIYVPLTLPITLVVTAIMRDISIRGQIENIFFTVILIMGTLLLSYLGARLGQKIGDELKEAGKL